MRMTIMWTEARQKFADVLGYIFNFAPEQKPLDDKEPCGPVQEVLRKGGPTADLDYLGPEKHPDDGGNRFWASVRDRTVLMVKMPREPYVHLTIWLEPTPKPPWRKEDQPKERQVACFDLASLHDLPDQTLCLKLAGEFLTMKEEELRHLMAEMSAASETLRKGGGFGGFFNGGSTGKGNSPVPK
jgi:hypothetical protein